MTMTETEVAEPEEELDLNTLSDEELVPTGITSRGGRSA